MRLLFSVICIGILLLGATGCSNWSDENIEESKQRGNIIAKALSEYRNDHSSYPEKLEDLLPKYLDMIQDPVAGNGVWQYSTGKDQMHYNLGFKGNTDYDPECWYVPEKKYWSIDTK